MDEPIDLLIEPDGTVTYVYRDDLDAAFADLPRTTRRASHVEPATEYCDGRRARRDGSAHLTATGWVADMRPSGGPVLWGPDRDNGYPTREAALQAERQWLRAHHGV